MEVLQLVQNVDMVVSAWHAEAEFFSILLRKRREGAMSRDTANAVVDQLDHDIRGGGVVFLPCSHEVSQRTRDTLRHAAENVFIRAADALHLACASVNGFQDIYSHDKHLLLASPLFGLRGGDVIS